MMGFVVGDGGEGDGGGGICPISPSLTGHS